MSGRLGVGTSRPPDEHAEAQLRHLHPVERRGKRFDGRAKVVPPPARPPSTGLRTCFEWPQDERPHTGKGSLSLPRGTRDRL